MKGQIMPDSQEIKEKIQELKPWFHNIHLPSGIQTAPDHFLGDFPAYKWEVMAKQLPSNLTGYDVLDVGCNAGFYSVELARRGAKVTAIDIDKHYLRQAEWVAKVCKVDDRITFYQMQVYDLARIGKEFDIIIFMGVFYHLRYPLLALDILSMIVKKMLIFQSFSLPAEGDYQPVANFEINEREIMLQKGWPVVAFIEGRFSGDPTNWWIPNEAAIMAMCRTCGLKCISNPGQEIYFFEPDPQQINVAGTWNKSEYLSAIGEEWQSEVEVKLNKP